MPSFPLKPQQFLRIFLVSLALATPLIPSARAGDEDQQAYCKYVTQQAAAQRDLLRTPDAIGGFTQPNTGLPTQVVWGLTGSLSNVRKATLTMEAARKDCELYSATASAQQAIQYAIPNLEKQALQNRLTLIQQASENLDTLVATTAKMVDAQNMTRPMAFALQTTKIKLEADRADTQSKIAAIYTPKLSDKPVRDLVAEKQAREVNERTVIYKLNRQNDWDVALSVGAHQQVNPLLGGPGAYGEVTVSYNLASHAINKHLDQSAAAYDYCKKVQEGDVIRNADVLKQQLVDTISVQENRLKVLQEQQKQIENNLQLLGRAETSAALDFGNQLSTAKLALQIEIGDATFRLDQLKDFLSRNF
jgi:chaperonin cofactor prefoldin